MKTVEILQDNEWLTLNLMEYPEKDIHGYVYSHEKRCNGNIVAILPYRCKGAEVMLRSEVTPCWHPTEEQISSITGGMDTGNSIIDTAVHELDEEAGYSSEPNNFESLGTCRGTKSTDTTFHLFAIDVSDKCRHDADGDGSELERKAHCFWTSKIDEAVDPLVYILYYRLLKSIKGVI